MFLEGIRTKNKFLKYIGFTWLITTILILQISGAHYTNDIIFGLVWSIASYDLGLKISYSMTIVFLKIYL